MINNIDKMYIKRGLSLTPCRHDKISNVPSILSKKWYLQNIHKTLIFIPLRKYGSEILTVQVRIY